MAGGDQDRPDNQDKGNWNFRADDNSAPTATSTTSVSDQPAAPADPNAVEWSASEFIAHDKNPLWYVTLIVIAALVTGIIYFISRDIVSVVAIVVLASVFGVAASRKPRIVEYRLDRGGITVGRRFHPYGDFKSFAVIEEGVFASITLLPLKRFNLPLSIYFSPDDEHEIMDVIANHLPLQPGALDSLDRFMRNIHF
ncbi:MAG TPA: hypothetical protein VF466_04170 [Candidatus Saccharimonadales bacterium]